MSNSKIKQIEKAYDPILEEIEALRETQRKIISKHIKILEKEKIRQLQKELQK